MSVEEKLKAIIAVLCESSDDASKARAGNASAGRRLRKTCMEAIHELKKLRALILEATKKEKDS